MALRARADRHVLLDLLPRELRVGLLVAPLQVGDDPLESRLVRPRPPVAVAVGDLHPLAGGAVEEQVALGLRQLAPRDVEVDAVGLGDRLGQLLVVVRRAVRPRQQRSRVDREIRIRHHELRVDLHLRAQAGAARARAVRRVEREDPRLELGHRGPATQAREALGEEHRALLATAVAVRQHLDLDQPVGQADRGLHRLREALAHLRPHDEAIDHDRDVVLVALVELDLLVEHPQLAVDQRARVAVAAQLLEDLAVLALAAADDRREHHEPPALRDLVEHPVDDLLDRLPLDRRAADVAVRLADPRPQQAQVVVDLRDGADGRPRVARRRLLIDRDRGRQPLDGVDVRLVHLPEELPRVGAQRLDVAALPLGVDRVERERGLAGSGQAGDDHQRVARQLEGDVLEVVLPGPRDHDLRLVRHAHTSLGVRTDVRVGRSSQRA